jgi:hypothetical protein
MQKKPLTKSNTLSLLKTLKKLGIKEMLLNIIKAIHDKPRANIILNGEPLTETISLKVRNKTGLPAFPTPFNIILDFLARAVR